MKYLLFITFFIAAHSFFDLDFPIHPSAHHKEKLPCVLPKVFHSAASKVTFDAKGCPTSFAMGEIFYDYLNKKIKFDQISHVNASDNATYWVDFKAKVGYKFTHKAKKCESFKIKHDLKEPRIPEDAKLLKSVLIGSQAIDKWWISKGNMNVVVAVTQGTCHLFSIYAFKSDLKTKYQPLGMAVMVDFMPSIPPWQFELPDKCIGKEPEEDEDPVVLNFLETFHF